MTDAKKTSINMTAIGCVSAALILTACGGGGGETSLPANDGTSAASPEANVVTESNASPAELEAWRTWDASANRNNGSGKTSTTTSTPTTSTPTTSTPTTSTPTTSTPTTSTPTTSTPTTSTPTTSTPTTSTPTTSTPTTSEPAPAPATAILSVGPGKPYSTPCQALKVAQNGARIEIDGSVSYTGDVCAFYANNLLIRGVNGRPKINAAGQNASGKGTWVVGGSNTIIENVELLGAKVPDRNGAGIRLDGKHLTVRSSFIHDNENGILTNNDGVSDIVIENTEFGHNGYGDGYTHNVYVGSVNSLTFRYNYSHDAHVGHNLKSRAKTNTIAYSRFSSTAANQTGSTASGQPSYEIDLPSGGAAYIIGNVIQQPAANQNPNLIAYGEEGAANPGTDIYIVNNTFLNDAANGTFVFIGGGISTPALIQNNVFAGAGTVTNQAAAVQKSNFKATSPAFVDRQNYDLRPAPGAAFINAGTQPGTTSSGVSLVPAMQYAHVAKAQTRPANGVIDIGAYEAAGQ